MLKDYMGKIAFQKRALDAGSLRHDIISNNIANIETPGYKRKELVFETLLDDAVSKMQLPMKKTHRAHMDASLQSSPYIKIDKSFSHRIDGNNVDIDKEMAEQAKNTVKYNALITQVSGQIKRMKLAIKGGR